MSIVDVHSDLLASLESALDVTKIFSVFNRLITVIRDQQIKIDETQTKLNESEEKILDLYAKVSKMQISQPIASAAPSKSISELQINLKIKELEDKIEDILLNIQGDVEEQADVKDVEQLLMPKEISPYLAFQNSSQFIVSPTVDDSKSFDFPLNSVDEEEQSNTAQNNNANNDTEKDDVKEEVEIELEVKIVEPIMEEVVEPVVEEPIIPNIVETASEELELIQEQLQQNEIIVDEPFKSITPPTIVQEEEQQEQEQQQTTTLQSPETVQADRIVSPIPQLQQEQEQQQQQQVEDKVQTPLQIIQSKIVESPTQPLFKEIPKKEVVVTVADETKTTNDQESQQPIVYNITNVYNTIQQVAPAPVPSPTTEIKIVPIKKITTQRSPFTTPIVYEELPPQPIIPVVDKEKIMKRRKMSVSNLKLVDKEKRMKILRELRKRGQYIHISRNMLEDSRKRYGNASLKQKVECLEADIKRLLYRIDKLRGNVKKNFIAIREVMPMNFHEVYEDLYQLDMIIKANGGVETMMNSLTQAMRLPPPNTIMCYDARGEVPQKIIDSIITLLKSTLLHEYEMNTVNEIGKLKARVLEISSNMITRNEIQSMLSAHTQESSSNMNTNNESSSNNLMNTDPNHSKLLNLINKSIDKYYQRIELANSQKKYTNLEFKGGVSANDLQNIVEMDQKYTDTKVKDVMHELESVQYLNDSRSHKFEMDLQLIHEKIRDIVTLQQLNVLNQSDAMENFKRESEAIKVLQRKVHNMNFDKLIDEMKKFQREIEERPSTSQIGVMMDLIETTFKGQLGEGIHDMKGLVEQVYKRIQHKVDREDIKKLISSKLAQMEADLLRREEENYSLTSTVRCLSCGQRPVDPNNNNKRIMTNSPPPHNRAKSPNSVIKSTPASSSTMHMMDDDVSVLSNDGSIQNASSSVIIPSIHSGNSIHNSVQSDEIFSLLTGTAGLKPLLQQSQPMAPVKDPYALNKRKHGEKIPEPLYRKARLAAHMKEMVKVPTPGVNFYGYGPSNPLYVLDGMVETGVEDNTSIQSADALLYQQQQQLRTNTRGIAAGGTRGGNRNNNNNNNISSNASIGSTSNTSVKMSSSLTQLDNINASYVGGGPRLHVNTLTTNALAAAGLNTSGNNSSNNSVTSKTSSTKRGQQTEFVVLPAINIKPTSADENLQKARMQVEMDQDMNVVASQAKLNSYY